MLTYTCAKLLSIMYRTSKAAIVRKYYADLDTLILTCLGKK